MHAGVNYKLELVRSPIARSFTLFFASMFAPLSNSNLTTVLCEFIAALWSAVSSFCHDVKIKEHSCSNISGQKCV